jgi:predicted transcriptional regulator
LCYILFSTVDKITTGVVVLDFENKKPRFLMNKRIVGALEVAILNVFRVKMRATVRDVYLSLGEERKYTTIMTVMNRLFKKKELNREKIGNQYIYWIDNECKEQNRGLLTRLKDKIFGGRAAAMVSYLLEMDDKISKEELEELEVLIEKKRAEEKL